MLIFISLLWILLSAIFATAYIPPSLNEGLSLLSISLSQTASRSLSIFVSASIIYSLPLLPCILRRSLSPGFSILIISHSIIGYDWMFISFSDLITSSIIERVISIVEISFAHDFIVIVQSEPLEESIAFGILVP